MNSKQPIVSVVMPVRNGESTIGTAIQSILTQTLTNIELIVVDDNSSDGTKQILHLLREKDDRIRVYSTEGTGISSARNTGLKHIRADLYACMDADDIACPMRLERQADTFLANGNLVLLGSFCKTFRDETGSRSDVTLPQGSHRLKSEIQFDPTFFHPSIMARSASLRKVGGYRSFFDGAEDHDLYLRLANVGEIDILPEYLLHYRLHDAQITQTKKTRSRVASLAAIQANERSLTEDDLVAQSFSIEGLAYDRLKSMCSEQGRLSKRQLKLVMRVLPALAAHDYDPRKLIELRKKLIVKLLRSLDFLAAIRFLKRTSISGNQF